MGDGDYAKAAEYIEPAITNETTVGKEKTWRYRGAIYAHIANGDDAALKAKYPDAVEKAVESFIKAKELDAKNSYKEENDRALMNLQVNALNGGNDAFTAKQYDKAIQGYLLSERIAKAFGAVDSNAVFNSALAYEAKGDTATAIQRYQECIKIGYDKPKYSATWPACRNAPVTWTVPWPPPRPDWPNTRTTRRSCWTRWPSCWRATAWKKRRPA
jgi:tetratricopeptide (TPR) repeat protein